MNRELLVKLIKKNIDELIMLTDGFLEMTTYPDAIISLAKNKTDDIWGYINELGKMSLDSDSSGLRGAEATVESEDSPETSRDVACRVSTPENIGANDDSSVIEEVVDFPEDEDVEILPFDFAQGAEVVVEEDIPVTERNRSEQSQSQPQTLAEKLSATGISRNEALAKENNGGVNASIAHAKVEDIRQAISLGDRFRFQRELFRNNGEEMNKTLAYINKLATYQEVVDFLKAKYVWEDDNTTVEDFYQIIQRKF